MEAWVYRDTLSVACALVRKYYDDQNNTRNTFENYQEVWTVELNPHETDRSYLFGRMLAYARKIEEFSLYTSGSDARQTNTERFMLQFRKSPEKTWDMLYLKLLPYLGRFRTKGPEYLGNRYEAEMNEVAELLRSSGGYTNETLSPLYLLGYQSQLNRFEQEYQKRKAAKMKNDGGN